MKISALGIQKWNIKTFQNPIKFGSIFGVQTTTGNKNALCLEVKPMPLMNAIFCNRLLQKLSNGYCDAVFSSKANCNRLQVADKTSENRFFLDNKISIEAENNSSRL